MEMQEALEKCSLIALMHKGQAPLDTWDEACEVIAGSIRNHTVAVLARQRAEIGKEWKPFRSAPKHWRFLAGGYAADGEWRVEILHWRKGYWLDQTWVKPGWRGDDGIRLDGDDVWPSHWMDLPGAKSR
jgi:hypothetical protein